MSDQMTTPEPAGPPSSGDEPAERERPVLLIAAAALVVVALIAGGLVLFSGSDDAPTITTAGEIFLQPVADVGPDPFFDDITTLVPGGETPITSPTQPVATTRVAGAADVISTQSTSGTQPGLYGGTRDNAVCDPDAIVSFLNDNPAKADAWATVHGISASEIPAFIGGLTPVTLLSDTRVTNHGFRNGSANGFQAVLQAGTAVLVDDTGLPRARCSCGNPLLAPVAQQAAATFVGEAWDGFRPEETTVVTPGPATGSLVLVDLVSNETFERPVGSSGGIDVLVAVELGGNESAAATTTPAAPATTAGVTTTSAPATSAAPTTTIAPKVLSAVTGMGSVSVSSTFGPDFVASLAVDGSASSSWFSAGGGSATFTWSANDALEIQDITIVGNGGHSNASFQTGFGFGAVTVEFRLNRAVVRTVQLDLSGTPDPTATATLGGGQLADEVVLRFSGGEDPTCGGFAEFAVSALL